MIRRKNNALFFFWISFGTLVTIFLMTEMWTALVDRGSMEDYRRESRWMTTESSQQYQKDKNEYIEGYCRVMYDVRQPIAVRENIARLVLDEVSIFHPHLTSANEKCISDARGM